MNQAAGDTSPHGNLKRIDVKQKQQMPQLASNKVNITSNKKEMKTMAGQLLGNQNSAVDRMHCKMYTCSAVDITEHAVSEHQMSDSVTMVNGIPHRSMPTIR